MSDLPRLKANEKLPRGTYFYIQVGHRFYAGEEAEIHEVKEDPTVSLHYYKRRGNRFGSQRSFSFDFSRGRSASKTRVKKDKRLDQAAKYIQPPKVEKEVIRKEIIGQLHPKFVDDATQAKRYRSKGLVDSACERLKALYADSGAQVSIRYKGADE